MRKELKRTLDEHIETALRAGAYLFDSYVYENANKPGLWGINLKAYKRGQPTEVWTGGKWMGSDFTEKAVKEMRKYFKDAEPLQLDWIPDLPFGTSWRGELKFNYNAREQFSEVYGKAILKQVSAGRFEVELLYSAEDKRSPLWGSSTKKIRVGEPRKAMKMAEGMLRDFILKDSDRHRKDGERIAEKARRVASLAYTINH